ncbi:ATP-binding protein [uncultured Sunxiuqinia sp.]|uniref:ATP-binding protein n=1 Tax=uncultured Sunxiuqinia sp. TaxID=1573825 RepID=UPI00374990B9
MHYQYRSDSSGTNIKQLHFECIKYTPEGIVTLGGRESSIPGNFDLFVKDTGIGISKEEQAVLFSRFTQIDNLKQGVGLGLAISHSLAQLLGSKIHVISKKGKGSEFYLSFSFSKPNTTSNFRHIAKIPRR